MGITEQSEGPLPSSSLEHPQLKGPKRNCRTLAIILGILFVCGFCLFSIVVSGFLSFMTTAFDSQENWLAISDAFMQAMVRKDADGAYALFSNEAKHDFQQSDLVRMTEGSFYVLFDGYDSLELESWEMNYNFPAGKFVELVYKIRYQDKYYGILQAVLKEDSDGWKLVWFEVTVPPDKLDDYVGL
jgi:hypothetical protein